MTNHDSRETGESIAGNIQLALSAFRDTVQTGLVPDTRDRGGKMGVIRQEWHSGGAAFARDYPGVRTDAATLAEQCWHCRLSPNHFAQ